MNDDVSSEIDPAIVGYRETEFRVYGMSPTTLKVGERSPALAGLHMAHGVDCSAFITACNPYSAVLDDAANADRQAELASELRRRRLHFVDGMGQHPSNGWRGEPSYLVFGLGIAAAKTLGKRFEQNAIVWSGSDAVPMLVLLK